MREAALIDLQAYRRERARAAKPEGTVAAAPSVQPLWTPFWFCYVPVMWVWR